MPPRILQKQLSQNTEDAFFQSLLPPRNVLRQTAVLLFLSTDENLANQSSLNKNRICLSSFLFLLQPPSSADLNYVFFIILTRHSSSSQILCHYSFRLDKFDFLHFFKIIFFSRLFRFIWVADRPCHSPSWPAIHWIDPRNEKMKRSTEAAPAKKKRSIDKEGLIETNNLQ